MVALKVGDKVRFVPDPDDKYGGYTGYAGKEGRITAIGEGPYPISVRFKGEKKDRPAKEIELEKLGGK
jgi:hypothetical protein